MPNSPIQVHHVDDASCSSKPTYSPEIRQLLDEASVLIEEGQFGAAEERLRPLVKAGNAEAQYLFSGFSLPGETTQQFEERCLDLLEASAAQGYSSAIYEIAVAFDSGDLVEQDKARAAKLFEQAAELGHIKAQWIHGTALLYGTNDIRRDTAHGLQLIRASASHKFVGALITLAKLHETGEFGVDVSKEESARLKREAAAEDAIDY